MATLHVENVVHDFESWKSVFDRFAALREEKGVRAYRMSREADNPNHVVVDLEFDTTEAAIAYADTLEQIWRTPQSQQALASHTAPLVLNEVESVTLVRV